MPSDSVAIGGADASATVRPSAGNSGIANREGCFKRKRADVGADVPAHADAAGLGAVSCGSG